MKKVSEEQIASLYQFTRAHFVEYYDIQTELVDHLASAIETQWQSHPELQFEVALQNEFKKFGVHGFEDVVAKRTKAMHKKYNKILWKELLLWSRWPKLFATFALVLVLHFTMQFRTGYIFLQWFTLAIYALAFFQLFRHKNKATSNKPKWLLEEIIQNNGLHIQVFGLFYQIFLFNDFATLSHPIWHWTLSILVAIFLLAVYLAFWVLPSKSETILEATYPERKWVQS
ncbi:MAG: hypothetical protein OIF50_11415 [Flavobacteriaceae bacterium]|nr:hypothetical protein [Flavobacteriaceae bacterium]